MRRFDDLVMRSSFLIPHPHSPFLITFTPMPEFNYDELRKKLNQGNNWPQLYMFKFIVPSDNHKIALVESLFDDDAEIKLQPSSKGKYTSLTARVVMLDADQIISIYKRASEIEGIISL